MANKLMVEQKNHNLSAQKPDFARDVLKMASAPIFTQAMGILIMPLLSRLYAPEAFGLMALFVSIAAPIGEFANLGYSSSIMLPQSDEEASNLLGACLFITVIISGLSVLLMLFGSPIIITGLKAQKLSPYLWLIPISIFLSGLYQSLRYWNMRNKRFGRIAKAQIYRFISNNSIILGIAYFGRATGFNFILGEMAASIVTPTVLGRRIWKENGELLRRSIRWPKMFSATKRYRKFPKYILWTNLLSRFTSQVPIYFLSYHYSQSIIGYYSLGLRLLNMPMKLVGNSIGEVFFQRASQGKDVNRLLENLFTRLVLFGMLPLLLLGFIGEDLFTIAFGKNWSEAGVYAQILSFLIFMRFITIPASYLMLIFEKQEFSLFLNIIDVIIAVFAITIGGLSGNIYLSFLLLSLLSGLLYATYGFFFMNQAGLNPSKIFKILLRFLVVSSPILFIVSLTKWYFHLSSLIVITISSVGIIIFYSIVLKQDAKLRSSIIELLKKIKFSPNR
ncbi:MAG: oligosaccharide flippase family protein [Candidatus Aminicenantes bacterium]|nr:oligosaccharide flippase family protein [Candidatus Aminicenantes bacterium]